MNRQEQYFSRKMFLRQFAPAFISSVGLAFGDMIDAIVLGTRMGVTGLAAISLSLPVCMVMSVMMHGLGAGGAIRFSKKLAAGNYDEASREFMGLMCFSIGFAIILAITGNIFLNPILHILGAVSHDSKVFQASHTYLKIILSGLPLFFFSYIMNYFLRNDDREKIASLGYTLGNICDIVLNIVFVLFLHKGVAGAACATLIGLGVTSSIYIAELIKNHGNLIAGEFKPIWSGIWNCFQVGFSTSSQYFFSMFFIFAANHILLGLGGETAVAVMDLVQNVSFLIVYLYDGTTKAMQPLVSTYYGECNLDGQKQALHLGLFWGSISGILVMLFVIILPESVCHLFGLFEPDAVSIASYALRVYCISGVFAGVNIILSGYYQSCGQERSAIAIAGLRGTIVLIPWMLLFSRFGIFMFWWMYPVTEISALLILFCWRKISPNKEVLFDQNRVYHRTICNSSEELSSLLHEIEMFSKKWDSTVKQQYFVNMTVEELCVMIMKNGFGHQKGFLEITLIAQDDQLFRLHIRDNATKFNPFSLNYRQGRKSSEPDMENIGIFMIKKKSKEFFYRRYQGFNTLIVKI